MHFVKKSWREILLGVLLFVTIAVWYLVDEHRQNNLLYVYFLDVGKGDAVLIDSPTHARVLIDGGPDGSILTRLGQILPFGDRDIDAVVESNPSASSITGLVDVLKEYKVGMFVAPTFLATSYTQTILNQQIQNLNIKKVSAQSGTILDIGEGAQIIFNFQKQNIAQVVYGTQTISIVGTSTQKMIEIESNGTKLIYK
jgi:beta-lactamase superfamily II metal-dependent hydrolase